MLFAIFNSEQKLFSILIYGITEKSNEIIKNTIYTTIEVFIFVKKYK